MKLRSNKYAAYSLKELYEARKNIDRQKYPKHYKDIVMQIGKKMTESQNFECVKCKNHRYDLGELYAPGDWFSKILILIEINMSLLLVRIASMLRCIKAP